MQFTFFIKVAENITFVLIGQINWRRYRLIVTGTDDGNSHTILSGIPKIFSGFTAAHTTAPVVYVSFPFRENKGRKSREKKNQAQ
jgi:amino acid permease